MRRADRTDAWALDDQTAERLLHGSLDPADAPPQYREVTSALRVLSRPPLGGDTDDRDRWVALIAVGVDDPDRRRLAARWARRVRLRVAVPVLVLLLSVTTGLAVAGALPGPAQDAASDLLAQIGIQAPSGTHGAHHDERPARPLGDDARPGGSAGVANAATTSAGDSTTPGPTSPGSVAPDLPGGGTQLGPGTPSGGDTPLGPPPGHGNGGGIANGSGHSNSGGNGNGNGHASPGNAGGNGNGNAGGNGHAGGSGGPPGP